MQYDNEPSPEVFQGVKIYICVEVKRDNAELSKNSAERNTSARITDDIPFAQLDSSFQSAILEQNENLLVDGKKVNCNNLERRSCYHCETHNSRNACLSSGSNQEQFHTLLRVELCEAKVGQDRS